MRIIIVGAGVIGANLADSLSKEDHEVYLIEIDKEIAEKVDEKIDAKILVGKGSDPEILKKAGVSQISSFSKSSFSIFFISFCI